MTAHSVKSELLCYETAKLLLLAYHTKCLPFRIRHHAINDIFPDFDTFRTVPCDDC